MHAAKTLIFQGCCLTPACVVKCCDLCDQTLWKNPTAVSEDMRCDHPGFARMLCNRCIRPCVVVQPFTAPYCVELCSVLVLIHEVTKLSSILARTGVRAMGLGSFSNLLTGVTLGRGLMIASFHKAGT